MHAQPIGCRSIMCSTNDRGWRSIIVRWFWMPSNESAHDWSTRRPPSRFAAIAFKMTELRRVYEIVWGRPLDPCNFSKVHVEMHTLSAQRGACVAGIRSIRALASKINRFVTSMVRMPILATPVYRAPNRANLARRHTMNPETAHRQDSAWPNDCRPAE